MRERREALLQRLVEEGRTTEEECKLLVDPPRLSASTALAYAAGASLVVLGAGLIGALWGVSAAMWLRIGVVSGLAAMLTAASWFTRRRLRPAALALYLASAVLWGAVAHLSGGVLWPTMAWAPAAEAWASLLVAAVFWRGWQGPPLTGLISVAGYLAVIATVRLLVGGSPLADHLVVDAEVAVAALMLTLGVWMGLRTEGPDHALWLCLIGSVLFDLSLIATAWSGTANGWWLVAAQATLVVVFWRAGRSALGGLAVLAGLAFLARQIAIQLLPHSPLGASVSSIVAAAATLVLGTVYLSRHPLPPPRHRGSAWWAPSER